MNLGSQFRIQQICRTTEDTIILKSITLPPVSKFKSLLAKAEKAAKSAGLKKR